MDFQSVMDTVSRAVNAAGVVTIVAGAVAATMVAVMALLRRQTGTIYDVYRRRLGRSILLGLEFLVAADIISTVAVNPTFESVGVLALIVLIRTFLSYSLELEITGYLPWQKPKADPVKDPQPPAEL
jgi:uncharacterized membrane protein